MRSVEYKFVCHRDVDPELVRNNADGPARVSCTLSRFGADGWRVVRFEQEKFGLEFWALLERTKEIGKP